MLNICHINIRSLSKHFSEFIHHKDLCNNDIICFSETWLNNSHPSSRFLIPGYNFIRKYRGMASRGGGLAIYMKKTIKFEKVDLPICGEVELVAIDIKSGHSGFRLMLAYNPPSVARGITGQFEQLLSSKILNNKSIILGDFNIDWDGQSTCKDNFETLMSLYHFQQLIKKPTRVFKNSRSIIDLIFTNTPSMVVNSEVIENDISDHFAIACKVSCQLPKLSHSFVNKRDYTKFNETEFFEHAKYVSFHHAESMQCAHKAAEFLENKIETVVDQFAPFKSKNILSQNPHYWRSSYISKLVKLKKKAFHEFIRKGSDKTSIYWEDYKSIRNKAANAIAYAKKKAMGNILHDNALSNWHKIKFFKGSNKMTNNDIQELEVEGLKITEDQEIANKLNSYFSGIGTELNEAAKQTKNQLLTSANTISCHDALPVLNLDHDEFGFAEVTICDVSKTLNSLKSRKVGGLNQIPAFIYKILEPLILNPLTHIINLSLRSCKFPDIWKKALVIPIHKGGDPKHPSNYRPISLLPILSKVLEKILSSQIRDYLDTHELLNTRQFGFRNRTSTDQLLLQIVDKIRHLIANKNSRFATLAALDVKKAFDCINHSLLVSKLGKNFSFNDDACSLMNNYLTNRMQAMKINGKLSNRKPVLTGVPQGSVMGPLLFIAFINDLMALDNCFLFADDCLIITHGQNPTESVRAMEKSLNAASTWYDSNLLVLNASKTDIMTISNTKIKSLPNLHFKNLSIKQSPNIKYLGVILDNKLTLKPHIKKLKQKLYSIISSFNRNRKFLSPKLAALWYTGLIRPILEYSAPLLYCTNQSIQNEIIKIENRCLKIIQFNQSKSDTRKGHHIFLITQRFKYLFLLSYYKLIHGIVPAIDKSLIPEKLSSDTRLAEGGGLRLAGAAHRFSLNSFGAGIYNDLPPGIRSLTTLKSFKASLRCHVFSQ